MLPLDYFLRASEESKTDSERFERSLIFAGRLSRMEEKLRKIISTLILIWLICVASACISEVKPLLKPVNVDLQTRISGQQKELDLGIAAHKFTPENAKPIQENLNRIKERYDRLKAQGGRSPNAIWNPLIICWTKTATRSFG